MSFSKMTKEDYKKQGLIIEALTEQQRQKENKRIKSNFILVCLSAVCLLASVVIAFAHPSDGLVNTPDFMKRPYAVTATSVMDNGKLYSVLGFVQRNDTPDNEAKEWLDNIIADGNGLVYQKCVETGQNVFLCQNIQVKSTGQNIGFLGVKSGISKEN